MNMQLRPVKRLATIAVMALSALLSLTFTAGAAFAEFRQTLDVVTVGFEGPSSRAEKQYVYSRGTPLEIVVSIEGWYKVRDAQGALVWVERKAVGERSNVQVIAPIADVHTAPDAISPVLFRVEQGVIFQLVTPPSATTGLYAQVRHRDGQSGYLRIDALFGL
jgi:SH3-like domain-containing protein